MVSKGKGGIDGGNASLLDRLQWSTYSSKVAIPFGNPHKSSGSRRLDGEIYPPYALLYNTRQW